MRHEDLTLSTPVHEVKDLFRQKPGAWPQHWAGWPNVCEAFRQLFDEAARAAPSEHVRPWEADRGIVICGGGWRFFPSIYVTVRAIRHSGCRLPIQVWYLSDRGEFDQRMAWALEPYGVGWIDANAYARANGIHRRVLGGWEVKPFAAMHAPYREVICLDADSYPAYNPEVFCETSEHKRVGATFWPDQKPLAKGQWERFGLPFHDEPSFESGQYVVDKARHYRALWLTDWMNNHSDFVYHHIYGDKDTFHLCWRKLGHECCIPTKVPSWHAIAFVQRDFEGRPLFIHRTRDKFRWTGNVDGAQIFSRYMTSQWHPETQFIPGLPLEAEGHRWCRESSELIRPAQHFKFPDGVADGWGRAIWDEVYLRNEYQLPEVLQGVALDIGAHAGAFSRACLRRGASHVLAVEPAAVNLDCLPHNLSDYAGRFSVVPAAVWSHSDGITLAEDPQHVPGNSSTFTACLPGGSLHVKTVTLDSLIEDAAKLSESGRVAVLKLDCEGGEYPALLGSTKLDLVDSVCGEAHERCEIDGVEHSPAEIIEVLQANFPAVRWVKNGPCTILFWAHR